MLGGPSTFSDGHLDDGFEQVGVLGEGVGWNVVPFCRVQ